MKNEIKTTSKFPKPLDSLKYKLGQDTNEYAVEIKKTPTSKKRKDLDKAITEYWDRQWQDVPDCEATVEQVKSWKPQGDVEVINYWKYACIAILLGIMSGMILATPTVLKLVEVCK